MRTSVIDLAGLREKVLQWRGHYTNVQIARRLQADHNIALSAAAVGRYFRQIDTERREMREARDVEAVERDTETRSRTAEAIREEARARQAVAEHVRSTVGESMRRIEAGLRVLEDIATGAVTDHRYDPRSGVVEVPIPAAVRRGAAKDLVQCTGAVVALTKENLSPEAAERIAGSLAELVGKASKDVFGPRAMDRSTPAQIEAPAGDVIDVEPEPDEPAPAPPTRGRGFAVPKID